MMRMLSALTSFLPPHDATEEGPRLRFRQASNSPSSRFNGHADRDLAAFAGRASDDDSPAHLLGALAHDGESEVVAEAVPAASAVEPDAVVADAEADAARVEV